MFKSVLNTLFSDICSVSVLSSVPEIAVHVGTQDSYINNTEIHRLQQ